MPKWIPTVASVMVGLVLGLTLGLSWPSVGSVRPASPAPSESKGLELHIRQNTYREIGIQDSGATAGDPIGHIIELNGPVTATLLVSHEIREQNRETLPLLSGEVLHRSGFSFAGLTDELLFVRNGKRLQIQREIQVETETPNAPPDVLPLEVIATFEIGEDTKITFGE